MEIRFPKAKAPPSRLQRQAPASLHIGSGHAEAAAKWDDAASHAAIPLLSPLIVTPSPCLLDHPEKMTGEERQEGVNGGETVKREPGGWCHPALAETVMEPAALVPCLKMQCALVHNGRTSPRPSPVAVPNLR